MIDINCIYRYVGHDNDHLYIPMCMQGHCLCDLADENYYKGYRKDGCAIDFGEWRTFVNYIFSNVIV